MLKAKKTIVSIYKYLVLYKYLAMIMQEKIKVMKKQIPNSSNSFLFHESYIHSKILTDYPQNPWGFITVPIPIPYPYPWESPWESPYPRQPVLIARELPRPIAVKLCRMIDVGLSFMMQIQKFGSCHLKM